MKFRKKPVVIEAVQYTEYGRLVKGMCNSANCFTLGNTEPHVHTIHRAQVVNLEVGDWIIPELDGVNYYPCKPDIFQATYDVEPVEPVEPVESASSPVGMNFGQALEAMKSGKKVSRVGWNGKGMHIACIKPQGSYAFDTDHAMMLEPFLLINNVKGTYNTWVPSISDCLAEDWSVVE